MSKHICNSSVAGEGAAFSFIYPIWLGCKKKKKKAGLRFENKFFLESPDHTAAI